MVTELFAALQGIKVRYAYEENCGYAVMEDLTDALYALLGESSKPGPASQTQQPKPKLKNKPKKGPIDESGPSTHNASAAVVQNKNRSRKKDRNHFDIGEGQIRRGYNQDLRRSSSQVHHFQETDNCSYVGKASNFPKRNSNVGQDVRRSSSNSQQSEVRRRQDISGNRGRGWPQRQVAGSSREGQRQHGAAPYNRSHSMPREAGFPGKGRPRYIAGYKRLVELLSKESQEIVLFLANSHNGFKETLMSPVRPDLMIVIMKLLSKVCQAEFHENKTMILINACEVSFIDNLLLHISMMPAEDNKERKKSLKPFLEDVLHFYETVMFLLPNTACEKFRKLFITTGVTMKGIEEYHSLDLSDLRNNFERLHKQFMNLVIERENSQIKESSKEETLKLQKPPDNFREKSIFPTPEDLSGKQAFVRPNIVHGAYQDEEHYLDVQFRLLREDFVAPLREGISKYVEQMDKNDRRNNRIDNVRIYQKVFFENPSVSKDRMGITLCFDPDNKMKKVIWEQTKRFMFGSLLCFTKDNFVHVIFGTVINRDLKDLYKGRIVVELTQDVDIHSAMFSQTFTMVESEVFFEPYHMVLKALQIMQPNAFPMKRYIVDVQPTSTSPIYFQQQPEFNFILDDYAIHILEEETWPDADGLKLDDSQYKAFKSALTKEFVVIQGPPGTGKTFLGLKVATALLKNTDVWNYDRRPILVVCYTNHALDQFLEGLIPVTDELLRVGGRSKSEVLNKFNLREKRYQSNKQRRGPNQLLSRDIHGRMEALMTKLASIQRTLEELGHEHGLVSLESLRQVGIGQQHLGCFQNGAGDVNDSVLVQWLSEGLYDFEDGVLIRNFEPLEYNGAVGYEPAAVEVPMLEPDQDDDDDERWQMGDDDPLMQLFDLDQVDSYIRYALKLGELVGEQRTIHNQIRDIEARQGEQDDYIFHYHHAELVENYDQLSTLIRYLNEMLRQNHPQDPRHIERLIRTRNLWELTTADRWILYKSWVAQLRSRLLARLHVLDKDYRFEARQYEEVRQMGDLEVMRDSLVVGMTTTGAAKLQPLLQALKAKIVIVEEAAEVLESHIVVSLTNHCEHLILIGDHQQLRPSTAVYRLARDFHFDVSLFERMLKNGMHCERLTVQHRMRPEVAQLVTPTIYPMLLNHSSVLLYPPVRGVDKSLFFVTHNYPEEEIEDMTSRRNTHESKFMMALCRHLILQGYLPDEITVLAAYNGQMFHMRSEQRKSSILNGVKITVVDNFQGEENRIILLSLVRSNADAKIGFLKIENRVCVALSRAREGFYIIGNMDNLTKSSQIWPKVYETLNGQASVGPHLKLRCEIHRDQTTLVASAADFDKVVEGGCTLPCNTALPCGHHCLSVCHAHNREHNTDRYKCMQPCDRVPPNCQFEHRCLKSCYNDCGDCTVRVQRTLACGHSKTLQCYVNVTTYKCLEMVEVELPHCGHTTKKPCYQDVATFPCPFPCPDRLPCGHSCEQTCHPQSDPDHIEYKCRKPCAKNNAGCSKNHLCNKRCHEECGDCTIQVQKKLPNCDHVHKMACSTDPQFIECHRKCMRKLTCGHPCPLSCKETCGKCPVKVTKIIEACGHPQQVKCFETPLQSRCHKPCTKQLPCGHPCTNRCSFPCTSYKCEELVPSSVRSACGHAVLLPCNVHRKGGLTPTSDELLTRCAVPCGFMLECSHRCAGTCGECMQGRIHIACRNKCGSNLICGHSCKVPCAKTCPPCTEKCRYSCRHSRCSRKCGLPCVPCKELCNWKCEHLRCTKRCHEECDREPCQEPCKKMLKCHHPCIGFCGDPCPPLCRICDKDEVTEVFFGSEDEEDARFVYLIDCRHTFESEGLEQWMQQTDNEIKLKTCPRCKSDIISTMRYLNVIKRIFKDVHGVKMKVFGNAREIDINRNNLIHRCREIKPSLLINDKSSNFNALYHHITQELQPVKMRRRNMHSQVDIQSLSLQVDILENLVKITDNQLKFSERNQEGMSHLFKRFDLLIGLLLQRVGWISAQEAEDFNQELQRYKCLVHLCAIECSPSFLSCRNEPKVMECHRTARALADCIEHYSEEQDRALKIAINDLNKALKNSIILNRDEERKMVVKAIGVGQGRWFKCPNGHYYVIGECGGAMQEAMW